MGLRRLSTSRRQNILDLEFLLNVFYCQSTQASYHWIGYLVKKKTETNRLTSPFLIWSPLILTTGYAQFLPVSLVRQWSGQATEVKCALVSVWHTFLVFLCLSFFLGVPAWHGSPVASVPERCPSLVWGVHGLKSIRGLLTLAWLTCGLNSPVNNSFWHGDLPSKQASGCVSTTGSRGSWAQLWLERAAHGLFLQSSPPQVPLPNPAMCVAHEKTESPSSVL